MTGRATWNRWAMSTGTREAYCFSERDDAGVRKTMRSISET
jgi:hypothetical protein